MADIALAHVREGDLMASIGDGEFAVAVRASYEVATAASCDHRLEARLTLSAASVVSSMQDDAAALFARTRAVAACVEADGSDRYARVEGG